MNESVKIRLANIDDLPELAKLDQETNLTYWSETEYQSSLDNRNNNIYVLEGEYNCIIGCIVINIILDEAEILQFWIALDYKKMGYGKSLLSYTINKLENKYKIKKIHLEAVNNNTPAIQLYSKLGFTIGSCRKNYYRINGSSYDALLMSYTY
ncbi:MAG: GNAT family N-acetyltransferase [Neisseriaceae bacterium]